MKQSQKPAVIGAGVVAAAIIVGIGVAVSPAGVIAAVTGVATLALVAVTVWYVRLTGDLVQAQRDALKQAAQAEKARASAETRRTQREAMVEIWRVCNKESISWEMFRRHVAMLNDGLLGEEAAKEMAEEGKILGELSAEIVNATPNVPDSIHQRCWETATDLMHVSTLLSLVRGAVLQVRLDALRADREPRPDEVRKLWTLDMRLKAGGLEWEQLVSGSAFDRPEKRFDELASLVFTMARDEMKDS